MARKKSTQILSVIVLLLALGALASAFLTFPPRFDTSLHQEIGRAMARETLSLYKPGGKIIVIKRDTAEFPQPASEAQFVAFQKELRRAQVPIDLLQELQVDPLRPVQVPPGDFFELLRKAQPGAVIASFMGPPLLAEEHFGKLQSTSAKVVAFISGTLPARLNFEFLFARQLLHSAVVAKPPSAIQSNSSLATFPRLYAVVNRANYHTVLR